MVKRTAKSMQELRDKVGRKPLPSNRREPVSEWAPWDELVDIDKKVGKQAEVQVSVPKPPREMKYDVPDWFIKYMGGHLTDLVAKARATGHEERTDFRVELAGSGTVGHLTVCTDGWRVWSPHPELVESWLGHLKPKG